MPEASGESKTNKDELQTTPVYPVPRKSRIVILSNEGETVFAEELLAIAFQIAGDNPHRKLEFWIRLND